MGGRRVPKECSDQIKLRVAPTCCLPDDLVKVIAATQSRIERCVETVAADFKNDDKGRIARIIKDANLEEHKAVSVVGVAEGIGVGNLETVRALVSAVKEQFETIKKCPVELVSLERSGADLGLSDSGTKWAYYYFAPRDKEETCKLEEYELPPLIRPISDKDSALVKDGLDGLVKRYNGTNLPRAVLEAFRYAAARRGGADAGLVGLFSKTKKVVDPSLVRVSLNGSVEKEIKKETKSFTARNFRELS